MKTIQLSLLKIFFAAFSCFIVSCNKSNDNIPASSALSGRSESQIRSLMIGRWKLHYTINYSPIYNVVQCNNCYWDFTANDTLTQTYNGSIYAKEKITYSKPSYSINTWIITSNALSSLTLYQLDSLSSDTLISTYQPTSAKSYLTKQ